MVMVLLDTGPTLHKRMAKSVIASKQHKRMEQPVRWGPMLFGPQPLNELE